EVGCRGIADPDVPPGSPQPLQDRWRTRPRPQRPNEAEAAPARFDERAPRHPPTTRASDVRVPDSRSRLLRGRGVHLKWDADLRHRSAVVFGPQLEPMLLAIQPPQTGPRVSQA